MHIRKKFHLHLNELRLERNKYPILRRRRRHSNDDCLRKMSVRRPARNLDPFPVVIFSIDTEGTVSTFPLLSTSYGKLPPLISPHDSATASPGNQTSPISPKPIIYHERETFLIPFILSLLSCES